MKYKKVFLRLVTRGGVFQPRYSEIKFNDQKLLGKLNVFSREADIFEIELAHNQFFFSAERREIEGKLCIVIAPVEANGVWFEMNYQFWYAGEFLPIRNFEFYMESQRSSLKLRFSRRYIDLTIEKQ